MTERTNLITAREQLGLTQAEAALLIGCHSNTIRNWERGLGGQMGSVIGAMIAYTHALHAYRDAHGLTHVTDAQLSFAVLFPDVVARAREVA